ncbi:hypothetical protein PGTUg99_010419 [Puccinia graminis f. sp. tritici]|uniref:Transmembrane protein n=1 Tax=Puccinia graminis f. sp. tritici TaxID=56615 RepID=A0A5B0N941_PUCGR|nr:hypothetical protein PGTUg99_010419 [Puccinia graminis f. sp. tritici]
MATQSVTNSTLPATGLPRSTSAGTISARQTSSLTASIPPQTQTSSSPAASASALSSIFTKQNAPSAPVMQHTDPFTRLSPRAIAAIVFVGAFVTVLCLAISFVLWRRKDRNPRSNTNDPETPSTVQCQKTPRHSKRKKSQRRPVGLVDETTTTFVNSIRPPSPVRARMTYIDQTSTSPPWSVFLGRGNSSILNWKPHDGMRPPLRLSSDTLMVLDPWLMRRSQSPPPPMPP